MDLGQQIRLARKRRNMTQAHLAKLLGVAPLDIDRWEGAICTPTPVKMHQISQILDAPSLTTTLRDDGDDNSQVQDNRHWRIWPWTWSGQAKRKKSI